MACRRIGLVVGDSGDQLEGQVWVLGLGADHVSQGMGQRDGFAAFRGRRDQPEAEVLPQEVLAATVLDKNLCPFGPLPRAANPEEDPVGVSDLGVPLRPLAAENVVHQHLGNLCGVLEELEVLQARRLVVDKFAGGRIDGLAAKAVVERPEVGADARAVPEAKPLLDNTLVHRQFGGGQHVFERVSPALDRISQSIDLGIGPTQLAQQRLAPVEGPRLGVLGDSPSLALERDGWPEAINDVVVDRWLSRNKVVQGDDQAVLRPLAYVLVAGKYDIRRVTGIRGQDELLRCSA